MAYAKMPAQTSHCTGTVIPTPEVTSSTAQQAQLTLDRAGLLPETRARPCRRPASRPARCSRRTRRRASRSSSARASSVSIAKPVTWVTVPDLIGLNVVAARSALRVAGFKVRETSGAYGKPAGRVYSQYPIPLQAGREGRARSR